MLNGKLSIEKADNGWILTWYETRKSLTTTIEPCREVFPDAFECLCRLAEVVGMIVGAAAARAVCELAESRTQSEDSSGPITPEVESAPFNAAVDPDVAELMPDHAPPTSFTGD